MHPLRALSLLVVAAAALPACDVDTHVEDLLSVERGVYGQGLSYDDVSGELCYLEDSSMRIYTYDAAARPGDDDSYLARYRIDERGFYEFALDAGQYWLCVYFRDGGLGSCTALTVADDLQRCDFEAGPGGGMWQCEPR